MAMRAGSWLVHGVLLAVAFGGGMLVKGLDGPAGPDEAPGLGAGAGTVPTRGPGTSGAAPLAGTPPAPLLSSARADALAPLRQVIEALPPLTIPRGTGVITGEVRTDEGAPLAGVVLTALPKVPDDLGLSARRASREEVDVVAQTRDYIDHMRWAREARVHVTSAADGSGRLEGLADVEHRVSAALGGWQIRPAPGAESNVRPGATVAFVATPRTQVSVEVLLPDGTVPEKAAVEFRSGSRTRRASWSAADPVLDVAPGTYEVSATSGEFDQLRSEVVPVEVEHGATPPTVRLVLGPRTVLRGTIVFPEGEAVSNVYVRVARVPAGRDPDVALLAQADGATPLVSAPGSVPSFQRNDLEPGTYLVGVARGWQGRTLATQVVEVTQGLTTVEVRVPALQRKEYAILHVTGPAGEPLTALEFSTGHVHDGGSSYGGNAVVFPRPDGEYWVLHHESAPDAKEGRFVIGIRHAQWGQRSVDYAAGSDPRLDVRFEAPAAIDVEVAGVARSPYAGRLKASLVPAGATRLGVGGQQATGPLDDDGHASLQGVQPGAYLLHLSLSSGPHDAAVVASEAVQVRSGEQRLRLVLPTLHEIEIQGLGGRGMIMMDRQDLEIRYFRTVLGDDEGRAIVDGLPAGTYTLHEGRRSKQFTLPGTRVVVLE